MIIVFKIHISKVDWRKNNMKEFRVAKCLVNGSIDEYAIFADDSRKKIIQTDKQYGKYFEVDNELNTNLTSCLRFSFSGRIKDAVDMIKDGNGDCIKSTQIFGRHDKVVYFLNRTIGEELRKKTLDGWKDTKFGWAIECGNKNSFSGYTMLNKKMERISVFDDENKLMTFDTEEAAKEYVDGLVERAKYYAKRLANRLTNIEEEKERDNLIDEAINEIDEYTGTKFSILSDFTFDMLTGDCELKSFECKLDNIGYNIVQCIIQ